MSNETSKLKAIREKRGDFDRYLTGAGIDIGCGNDPLQIKNGSVAQWDKQNGDAMLMIDAVDEYYDFVYSSHTLEHMDDVHVALTNWVRILKPGGYIYLVVPDYELYEQCVWPSRWNPEHKSSFSLTLTADRESHYLMTDVVDYLDGIGVDDLGVHLEDDGYDYNGIPEVDQTEERNGNACAQICYIGRKR